MEFKGPDKSAPPTAPPTIQKTIEQNRTEKKAKKTLIPDIISNYRFKTFIFDENLYFY